MRTIVLLVMGIILGSQARAQGTVDFKNSSPVNQPVTLLATGVGLDSAWAAQLYWSSAASGPFVAVMDPPAIFRDGAGRGYWKSADGTGSDRQVGVPPGAVVYLKVRVWNTFFANTYEEAPASGGGWGESSVFAVTTGGAGAPPSLPAAMTTFKSFMAGPISTGAPPVIVSQPVSQNFKGVGNYSFTMRVEGMQPIRYRWFVDDQIIPGANSDTLVLTNATAASSGVYRAEAGNPWGIAKSALARFGIGVVPEITQQPRSSVIPFVATIVNSVQAVGAPELSYQWYRNGSRLEGANQSSLTIYGFSGRYNGDYVVVVSNTWGSVTSVVAHLTVEPLVVGSNATITPLNVGESLLVSEDTAYHEWFRNGVYLPEALTPILKVVETNMDGKLEYAIRQSTGGGADVVLKVWRFLPPKMISAPSLIWAQVGQSVIVTGNFGGSLPMLLQLLRNGQVVTSSTNGVLPVPQVQTTNSSSYAIRASNELGSDQTPEFQIQFVDVSKLSAGGTVDFRNYVLNKVNAYVTDERGIRLSGPNKVAQLYYAKTAPYFVPVDAPPVPFQSGSGAGYWSNGIPIIRTLRGVAVGESVALQVRAWNIEEDATYEQAEMRGGAFGKSKAINVTTGGALASGNPPAPMVGLEAFSFEGRDMTLEFPIGLTLFTVPLAVGDGTVGETFRSAPYGTVLFQYNSELKRYSLNFYEFMAWSNPSEKVNLGGGAFFLNAGYTPFRLSLRGHLPVPALVTNRVPGFRLVSGTVGRPVAVDSLLGFPPKDGDTVYQFTNGTYAVHSFQFGQWDGGTPMLRVDESAFLFLVP